IIIQKTRAIDKVKEIDAVTTISVNTINITVFGHYVVLSIKTSFIIFYRSFAQIQIQHMEEHTPSQPLGTFSHGNIPSSDEIAILWLFPYIIGKYFLRRTRNVTA